MTRQKNKLISILVAFSITLMAPLQLFASMSLHNGSMHIEVSTIIYKAEMSCLTSEQKNKKQATPDCEVESSCHSDSCSTSASCPSSSTAASLLRQSGVSVYIQFSFANAPYSAEYIPDFTENTLLRPPRYL